MLSQILKELRATRDITQADLAKFLGITQQAVAKWETNKAEPDNKTLKILADYFHVSTDELLGRDAPRKAIERALLAPPDGGANPTKEMLDNYSSLSAEGKEKARSFIKYLVSEDKESRIKKDFGKSTTA